MHTLIQDGETCAFFESNIKKSMTMYYSKELQLIAESDDRILSKLYVDHTLSKRFPGHKGLALQSLNVSFHTPLF
ncbi:hypothetical protein AYR62_04510 [Secundilactobacillus paracollinoides]|uniref:Uncharacterized protein n=1 Tax=Secundilactobacillus paracollinoides TaxID=240427 RepID=A0A1B2J0C4_9LACO|nr:hypothetical protein AYR61_10795 [Secundilactobacillus paracollinoides]ANZ63415.1 hypothetical protein AYR62_04510 [Secundilactobacillus paracollinoides]ANZ67698.1 hypothetical protein AYR63_11550 [Secundilactobacillus paracollinoides]